MDNKEHKPCPHCGTTKPSAFYNKCCVCKVCVSKQSRERYAERRQRHLEWREKWTIENLCE